MIKKFNDFIKEEFKYGGTFAGLPGATTSSTYSDYFSSPPLPKSYKEYLDELIEELSKKYNAKIVLDSQNNVIVDGFNHFKINWKHMTTGDVRYKLLKILEAK